ncbi:MAG: hypothetical protein ACREMR_09230 [Gemmatimonadales bacterium]
MAIVALGLVAAKLVPAGVPGKGSVVARLALVRDVVRDPARRDP